MTNLSAYLKSSIGKKQIVAATGLMLILFVLGHLAGNLLIYLGPEAFNNYAKKLASLRPGLYFIEIGLFLVFLTHIYLTALIVLENVRARSIRYQVYGDSKKRSLATRLMPFTGTYILGFVIWHLLDFTFIDKHGPRAILPDGNDYGLYGVVFNAFADPIHSLFYIIAMMCLGLHLAHGIYSFAQTFGFNQSLAKKISGSVALFISVAYSSIPVYVYFVYQSMR